jgi:hypothetical protein
MQVHLVDRDPGLSWVKDETPAIEAPPDPEEGAAPPAPDAQWSADSSRTGVCGAVSPNVIGLPDGGYRMYYCQMLPRAGHPAGANDYANCTTRLVSAHSTDTLTWTPEPGVRLGAQEGGAGEFRVVSPCVVPVPDGSGHLRMYYECSPDPKSGPSTLRSAISEDRGLQWVVEEGARISDPNASFHAPRLLYLDDGSCRLYYSQRGKGIVSALSNDGLTFDPEPGVRVQGGTTYDAVSAFAPEVLRLRSGGYRMYFSGYSASTKAQILGAVSEDGLTWRKEGEPVIPSGGRWDAAKASEMCLAVLPPADGESERYRMFYEVCDGTALDKRGVWRIAGATAAAH